MINNKTAIVHNGTATFVRNNNGIPVTVIPMTPRSAINPKQMLWHTCHEPKMLAAPEMLPVAPTAFSLIFLIILKLPNFFLQDGCIPTANLAHTNHNYLAIYSN